MSVVLDLHLGQIDQFLARMIFIEEIIAIVVVDFKIADVHRELMGRVLGHMPEYITQRPRNQPTIGVPLGSTSHGEGLARACLPIGENSAVVAFEATVDHVLANLFKYCFLSC